MCLNTASNYTFQNLPYMIFTKLNQCLKVKNDGANFWTKTFPVRVISAITIAKINDAVIFTTFDNVENNVFLYDHNGVVLDQIMRPANAPGQTTAFGNYGQSITTLLGNVLIQYPKY